MVRGKVFDSEHRPETCPNCGSTQIADILYGLFAGDPSEEMYGRKVVLGGCCVRDEVWTCTDCNASFRQRAGSA